MDRRPRIILDTLIAHAGALFGWVNTVFWGLIGVAGFFVIHGADEIWMPVISLGLAALHALIIRSARRTKDLVKDFRLYSSVLAQDRSVSDLSEAVGSTREEVLKKLREMCRRGYFNGHIDLKTDTMTFREAPEGSAARCPGCGAAAMVYRSGDLCRYCGTPLTVRKSGRDEM